MFINVNFPDVIDDTTEIVIAEPESYKYKNYLREQRDPAGSPYYWLWGDKREDFDKTRDAYQVVYNKKIAVSPISFQDSHDLYIEAQNLLDTHYTK